MGGRSSKQKGNGYERELVNQARSFGLDAQRAWGSNGKSLGLHEEVDLVVSGKKIQAKRKKQLLKGLNDMIDLLNNTDAVVFRQDNSVSHVIITWENYLQLVSDAKPTES